MIHPSAEIEICDRTVSVSSSQTFDLAANWFVMVDYISKPNHFAIGSDWRMVEGSAIELGQARVDQKIESWKWFRIDSRDSQSHCPPSLFVEVGV